MVNITVEDRNGTQQQLEIPTDMGLNLMEFLKASEYDIMATCGGMAMCATCHIEVLEGLDKLGERIDQEYDMLDTLPDADDNSRLACQLQLKDEMDGMVIKIRGEY
ncbi:(2Fe-2S)-binding protein [Marinoscillum pacificum]|uniref:(2Fe-2S)-binding protein n=1 Tax=Marinoscillum pacificum TaxID=392723 RepID=UPI0021581235|nr:(2Fe-2S)-binding protein [Marinoscillum pacificum]